MQRADDLSSLPPETRQMVEFARSAVEDTYSGGCAALTIAKRRNNADLEAIVSEVYSVSSGKVPNHLDAWECPECGSVHYGREAAAQCCAMDEYYEEEEEEDSEV